MTKITGLSLKKYKPFNARIMCDLRIKTKGSDIGFIEFLEADAAPGDVARMLAGWADSIVYNADRFK